MTIMKAIKELLIEKQTEKLIRRKYSLNDELKMARKGHDSEEWAAYNTYIEECIVKAKEAVEKQLTERSEKLKNIPSAFRRLTKTATE